MDDPLFPTGTPIDSANTENKTLKAMKQCFEENATTLKQVNYNLSPNISTRSTENDTPCCCAQQSKSRSTSERSINIVPKWECASLWEGEKMIYAEIPLSGKGNVTVTPGTGGGGSSTYTKTYPYCRLQYSSVWDKCPNGCEDVCSKCGKAPCQCASNLHVCEQCGSNSCPGPWFCGASSGGGNGSGNNNGEDNNDCDGTQCKKCGGYKNNTNANCPKCTCIDIRTIDIGVFPTSIDLGEQFTIFILDLSINTDAKIISTDYQIAAKKSNEFISIGKNEPLLTTYKAYSPGQWKVKAISTFSDGATATSTEFSFTVVNPLYSTIMNNTTVINKMNSLWKAAVEDAQKKTPIYHEKGCIILFNTTDNSYEFEDVADSNEFNCDGITEIHFSFSTHTQYPIKGGRHPVATFHTHPARTKCDKEVGHEVGPSEIDKKNENCLLAI